VARQYCPCAHKKCMSMDAHGGTGLILDSWDGRVRIVHELLLVEPASRLTATSLASCNGCSMKQMDSKTLDLLYSGKTTRIWYNNTDKAFPCGGIIRGPNNATKQSAITLTRRRHNVSYQARGSFVDTLIEYGGSMLLCECERGAMLRAI
jgi:hypothetical protein